MDAVRVPSRVTYANITFVTVDFTTHVDRFKPGPRISERVGSYGYGMMCRFFSGVVQAHPALDSYSHYIRLDDDSYLLSELTPDVLSRLVSHDYTYRCVFDDPCPSLWDFAFDFMRKRGFTVNESLKARTQMPYTNYHSSSLRLWRHPMVLEFTSEIENTDGCLTQGWDDAMIGGVIAYLICPAIGYEVHYEKGFCYRHNQHCSHRAGFGHSSLCVDDSETTNPNWQWGPPIC